MRPSPDSLLRMTVDVPRIGDSIKIEKGALALTLENYRGGLRLSGPASAGGSPVASAREQEPVPQHFLGLAGDGWLELAVRAPEHRVRVSIRDRLTVVPGGRLRGYVTVPLPHRLSWCRSDGRADELLDVAPRGLRMSWLGEGKDGGYVHDCESAFYLDRRGVGTATQAIVPVVLLNHSQELASPESLTVHVRGADLREIDDQIVTSPRRLHFGESATVDERIRSLPRRSA